MIAMDGVNAANAGAHVVRAQASGKNYAATIASSNPDSSCVRLFKPSKGGYSVNQHAKLPGNALSVIRDDYFSCLIWAVQMTL